VDQFADLDPATNSATVLGWASGLWRTNPRRPMGRAGVGAVAELGVVPVGKPGQPDFYDFEGGCWEMWG